MPRTSLSEKFPERSGDITVLTPRTRVRLDLPKWVPETPEGAPAPEPRGGAGKECLCSDASQELGVDKIAAHVRFQQIQIKFEKISLRLNNKTSPNEEVQPQLKRPALHHHGQNRTLFV